MICKLVYGQKSINDDGASLKNQLAIHVICDFYQYDIKFTFVFSKLNLQLFAMVFNIIEQILCRSSSRCSAVVQGATSSAKATQEVGIQSANTLTKLFDNNNVNVKLCYCITELSKSPNV